MQKFNRTGINQRSLIFDYSTKKFAQIKKNIENNKKLRKKIENTNIYLNNSVLKQINKTDEDVNIENTVKFNTTNIPKKSIKKSYKE